MFERLRILALNLTHSFGSVNLNLDYRRSVRHVPFTNGRTAAAAVPASTVLRMLDFIRGMAALIHSRNV